MKTRIFCLVLVLIMALSCFVGCNTGGNNNDNGGNNGGDNGGNNGGNSGGLGNLGGGTATEDSWWSDIAYKNTELTFMMTHNSNMQELPSGCGRYLAGDADYVGKDDVDTLVKKRNDAAYATTNVTVKYQYYPDSPEYGFNRMYDQINAEVMSGSSYSPDMFCNFMTDLLVTSLKGSFSNLKSIGHGEGDYRGKNYFRLEDPGYMADLMGSLTLSPEKIYVIASDYFMDLIRAFFIVPVNAELYNQIAPEMIEDLNGDGENDVNDIFLEVKNGDWTYDRLAEYADAIYSGSSDGGESIEDTLGFGLGVNGLVGAGLVYTSYVSIINKVSVGDSKYEYSYSSENQDLYDLADAITELVGQTGIKAIDSADVSVLGAADVTTPLLAIRHQFTNNKMLFGGIILVGSLEYQQYQDMKNNGEGFGVLPVPVYEKNDHDNDGEYGDEYLTQIHVVGRAGGISAKTKKFVQCSSFLHYQSSHSTDVLNEYYDYNLMYDTASGVEGNVDMLKYIRENVRTSFDKLYEDAVGFLASDGNLGTDTRWHDIVCTSYFEVDLRGPYQQYWKAKNQSLQNLVNDYDKLPS